MQTKRENQETQETVVVSFDFDDTLAVQKYSRIPIGGWTLGGDTMLVPRVVYLELLKEYHALGCEIIILTARSPTEQNELDIKWFLEECKIDHCVSRVVYTSHQPKGPFAAENRVKLHYDDDKDHLQSVRDHGIAVVAVPLK